MKDGDTIEKERSDNFRRWFEALTPEQRSVHGQRAARALWGPKKDPQLKATDGAWVWPIDVNCYDRSAALTDVESEMLTRYAEAYRFYRYGRTMDFGPSLDRLVSPLNDVFDYTGIKTEKRRYVLLFFLREMANRNRSFWGWTTEEWIDSIDARRPARQHSCRRLFAVQFFGFASSQVRPHRVQLPRPEGIWT